jgi:hypothetical protein
MMIEQTLLLIMINAGVAGCLPEDIVGKVIEQRKALLETVSNFRITYSYQQRPTDHFLEAYSRELGVSKDSLKRDMSMITTATVIESRDGRWWYEDRKSALDGKSRGGLILSFDGKDGWKLATRITKDGTEDSTGGYRSDFSKEYQKVVASGTLLGITVLPEQVPFIVRCLQHATALSAVPSTNVSALAFEARDLNRETSRIRFAVDSEHGNIFVR